MTIRFRQLMVLREIMESGSVTGAAKRLGQTQSAVSHSLTKLEKALGFRLFARESRQLVAYPEAQVVLDHANQILNNLHRLDENAALLKEHGLSHLRLASPPGLAHGFIPAVLAMHFEHNPGSSIRFEVSASHDIVRGVASGNLDLGISALRPKQPDLVSRAMFSSRAVCLMPRNHPLANNEMIALSDLQAERLIIPSRDDLVDDPLRSKLAGNPPPIRANVAAMCVLVANGVGVCVINPITVHDMADSGKTVSRPFAPTITHTFYLVARKNWKDSATYRHFAELIRRQSTALAVEIGILTA